MVVSEQCPIRISTIKDEGAFQVSKWLHAQILLDPSEMQALFDHLGHFVILMTSKVCQEEEIIISHEKFLDVYARFIDDLKHKAELDRKSYQPYFSSTISKELSDYYAIKATSDQYLVKPSKPVIQMQPFCMKWDESLHQFMTKVLSKDLVPFGVQFSFPQIYQDPKTFEILEIFKELKDPNAILFKSLQKWVRDYTKPTPFMIEGKKINASFRIGHKVLTWIEEHQLLQASGLAIKVTS